jgi:hypothetical protein
MACIIITALCWPLLQGDGAHGLDFLSLSLTTSQAAEGAGPLQSSDPLLQRLRMLADSSASQLMEELPSTTPTPPSTPLSPAPSESSEIPSLVPATTSIITEFAGPQMCLGLWLLSRVSITEGERICKAPALCSQSNQLLIFFGSRN